MAKNLEKLTGKGPGGISSRLKAIIKRIKNPTFEIAPNEVLNRDPRELLGGSANARFKTMELVRKTKQGKH